MPDWLLSDYDDAASRDLPYHGSVSLMTTAVARLTSPLIQWCQAAEPAHGDLTAAFQAPNNNKTAH